MSESLWARYFGRAHIGSIRGVSHPVTILGSALAPVLVGVSFDLTQTYRPAFVVIMFIFLLGAALVYSSREPSVPDLASSS